MKRIYLALSFVIFLTSTLFAKESTTNFVNGKPDFQSMGSLAFGPEGILFIGDSQGGSIFAIELNDKTKNAGADKLEVEDIEEKIAAMLGTRARDISIHDLAVNPLSQNAYLSLSRGKGK